MPRVPFRDHGLMRGSAHSIQSTDESTDAARNVEEVLATAAPDPMAKTLAGQFAGTLSAHDIDAFAALFADDFVNHQRTAAVPPPPAGTRPKDATVAYFASRLKGMPDLAVSIEATVVNADMFAASFVYEGTHKGVYFGIEPTGKRLRFTSCDIFRVASGKIAEHWGMGDIAGTLAQLKSSMQQLYLRLRSVEPVPLSV